MRRFRNILAVVDPSRDRDVALDRAARLAMENGARLSAIACLDDTVPRGEGDVIRQAIIAGLSERLAAMAQPLRERDLKIDSRIVFGEPFIEIIRRVLRGRHDLVVKAAHHQDLENPLRFGSTDLHLLRKCPCPLWMINAATQQAGSGVLACVDPIADDDRDNAVARMVMELATSLAALEGSPCHAVHAWTAPFEHIWADSPWLQIDPRDIEELTALAEDRHATRFQELVAPYRAHVDDLGIHLRYGDPAGVIVAMAEELRVEVIVLSTIGRSGIAGLFIGNTAETVLSQVNCSVLAIKPEGFVSPVTAE